MDLRFVVLLKKDVETFRKVKTDEHKAYVADEDMYVKGKLVTEQKTGAIFGNMP